MSDAEEIYLLTGSAISMRSGWRKKKHQIACILHNSCAFCVCLRACVHVHMQREKNTSRQKRRIRRAIFVMFIDYSWIMIYH